MLEGKSTNQLATKSQRREAVQESQKHQENAQKKKEQNYVRAFDRIKERNKKAKDKPQEDILDLDDIEDEQEDYALV